MNLAQFPFRTPPPTINSEKKVIVKIGHNLDTPLLNQHIVNKITNFDNTICHFRELYERKIRN